MRRPDGLVSGQLNSELDRKLESTQDNRQFFFIFFVWEIKRTLSYNPERIVLTWKDPAKPWSLKGVECAQWEREIEGTLVG